MNEQLMTLGLGFVLGTIAKRLVNWWTTASPTIEDKLGRVDDYVAGKLGVTLPASVQTTWHDLIHAAVEYANKFAGNGRFWREVIRAIVTRNPAQAVILMNELQNITWDKGIAAVEAQMSPDLKVVVAEVKETFATRAALANAITARVVPIEAATDGKADPGKLVEAVRAAVRAAAPAHKADEGPITRDKIDQMILDSQRRQAKLEATK